MSLGTLLQLFGLVVDAVRLPFRRARTPEGLSTDASRRKDELHALAGSVARTAAATRIKTLVHRDRREEIEREALERAARQAVQHLGQMKGMSMKLGQQMSYLNALPDEAEKELAALQASVPPLEPDELDALLHQVFGRRLEKVFSDFQREPIAAASIGQVHRARLQDGRDVAVKLQYPGVAEAMRADLDNMAALTTVSQMTIKSDMNEYMRSLNDSFLRELDYTLEQRNQQRLADLYRGHPYVLVPETVPELCGPNVLVSEFVEGATLQMVTALATPEQRNRYGEIMYRFAFGCIEGGLFSGDPHPGNYLFPKDGRVCFLDFGMVIEFAGEDQVRRISKVLAGGLTGDEDLLAEGLRGFGMMAPGVEPRALWEELEPLIAGPIQGGPVRLDRTRFQESLNKVNSGGGKSALATALTKSGDLQSWTLLWLRYALGAQATISKFAAEVDWRQCLEEIVLGAEPAGEIGRTWGAAPGGAGGKASSPLGGEVSRRSRDGGVRTG